MNGTRIITRSKPRSSGGILGLTASVLLWLVMIEGAKFL